MLIGRPYLYGLGVEGAAEVTRVVKIPQREFEMAMALAGGANIKEIDRSLLWTSGSDRSRIRCHRRRESRSLHIEIAVEY